MNRKQRLFIRKYKSTFFFTLGLISFLLVLGLAGHSDYQSCIQSAGRVCP